jgi:hypothetical protein
MTNAQNKKMISPPFLKVTQPASYMQTTETLEVSSDIEINLQHPITLRSVLGSGCNNVM